MTTIPAMTCPSGKQQYVTPAKAWADKVHMEKRGARNKGLRWAKGSLMVYHCKLCGMRHIGHAVIGREAA
jgi:hypothetical protein